MKDIKEELLKCREFPHSRIGRLNTVKMSVLPNLICRFNTNTIKVSANYFMDGETDSKVYMQRQKIQNIQLNTEEEQSWKTDITKLKTYSKATVVKTV